MTGQPKAAPFTTPDGMKKILLRRREVESITGFSRSHLYGLMKLGRFPRPVKLSPGCVRWQVSDIEAWMDEHRAMKWA